LGTIGPGVRTRRKKKKFFLEKNFQVEKAGKPFLQIKSSKATLNLSRVKRHLCGVRIKSVCVASNCPLHRTNQNNESGDVRNSGTMASEMDKLKEHIMAARKHSVQALTYLENSYEALEEEWKRLDNAKRLFANGASNSPGEKQRAVYNIINWKGAIPETHVESFKGTLGAKLVVMHDSVESLIANTGNVPTTLVIRREQMWRGETLSRAVKEFLANKGNV
jgi:hypothetical protein